MPDYRPVLRRIARALESLDEGVEQLMPDSSPATSDSSAPPETETDAYRRGFLEGAAKGSGDERALVIRFLFANLGGQRTTVGQNYARLLGDAIRHGDHEKG